MMAHSRLTLIAVLFALMACDTARGSESTEALRPQVRAFSTEVRIWSIPRKVDFKSPVGVATFEKAIGNSEIELEVRTRDRVLVEGVQSLLSTAVEGVALEGVGPNHVLMKVELVGAKPDARVLVAYIDDDGAVWISGRGFRAGSGPGFYREFWSLVQKTFE